MVGSILYGTPDPRAAEALATGCRLGSAAACSSLGWAHIAGDAAPRDPELAAAGSSSPVRSAKATAVTSSTSCCADTNAVCGTLGR
jgi:hypothetical protein